MTGASEHFAEIENPSQVQGDYITQSHDDSPATGIPHCIANKSPSLFNDTDDHAYTPLVAAMKMISWYERVYDLLGKGTWLESMYLGEDLVLSEFGALEALNLGLYASTTISELDFTDCYYNDWVLVSFAPDRTRNVSRCRLHKSREESNDRGRLL